MIPPKLLFIRHGETSWNFEGRLQGQKDIPLNKMGQEQADTVGRLLARLIEEPKDWNLFCSPLGRTRETMERAAATYSEISNRPLAQCQFDDRLLEVTFGDLEGLTLEELHQDEAYARLADPWNFRPPNGESYADGAKRAIEWMLELNRPTIVVSHGGICRGLRKYILNLNDQEAAQFKTPQGVVVEWIEGTEILHTD